MNLVLYNGELIPEKHALIPIEKKEVLYSFGVYESLKVKEGIPLYLDEHMVRFYESARIMGLSHPFPVEDITDGIAMLIRENKVKQATIRIQMYGGDDPFYYAYVSELPRYPAGYYEDGIEAITYPGERFLPAAKSNCLLLNYMAQREAVRRGAVEALLLNHRGILLEGSRSNLFAIREGLLFTSHDDVLHGVTREHIIEYCRGRGGEVCYSAISMNDVEGGVYDGLCISSTSMGLVPIYRLDGAVLPSSSQRWEAVRKITAEINYFLADQEAAEIVKRK